MMQIGQQTLKYQYYPVMQTLNNLIEPLKPTALDKIPQLQFIQDKYKLKPSTIAILLFVALLLLSSYIKTHSLLTSIVCYLVPAYLSFKALQSEDKNDDIKFLTYWIVFSMVELANPFLKYFFNKFFFMLFRMLVTLILLHPLSDLSLKCYNYSIRPLLIVFQKQVDNYLPVSSKKQQQKK